MSTSPASIEVAAARLHAQLLDRPVAGAEQVVDRLLAVQAQDARAFRLAVRARTRGRTAADVDAALSERRSLVVSWLFRGTLHLVAARDYAWLHALTAPRITPATTRRLAQLGLDEKATARGVAVVTDAVADGPRGREQLRRALDAAGVPTAGQALAHLLAAASLREHLVRGPVRDGEHCFVDARRWLGPLDVPDRPDCLALLARRHLVGHGPAAPADLAAYAGVTLTDARAAFALVEAETVAAGGDGLRVLDGVAAGTWTLSGGAVTLQPFGPLTGAVLAALDAESHDVLRFLGRAPAALVVVRRGRTRGAPRPRD